MDNGNPWELVNNENVTTNSEMSARHEKAEKIRTIVTRILGWILLGAFLLYLPYAIFVHPVDKLKLRILLTGSFEIEVKVHIPYENGIGSSIWRETLTKVKVDGPLVCVTDSSGNDTYYEVDGKTVYMYTEGADGEWTKQKTAGSISITGGSSANDIELSVLLNRRNYEKVKGELFLYRIKDGIDIGGFDSMEFQRLDTRYEMRASLRSTDVTITFGRFGTTKITPPWEE